MNPHGNNLGMNNFSCYSVLCILMQSKLNWFWFKLISFFLYLFLTTILPSCELGLGAKYLNSYFGIVTILLLAV